jgi:hypothetical protein
MEDKAFSELLVSSSHECICCDAYASWPRCLCCTEWVTSAFHCSALAWKYVGTHWASLWMLACSSIHRWNWALARSQWTLLTICSMSIIQMHQSYWHLHSSIHVPSWSTVAPKLQIHGSWVLRCPTCAAPRIAVLTRRSSERSCGSSHNG